MIVMTALRKIRENISVHFYTHIIGKYNINRLFFRVKRFVGNSIQRVSLPQFDKWP